MGEVLEILPLTDGTESIRRKWRRGKCAREVTGFSDTSSPPHPTILSNIKAPAHASSRHRGMSPKDRTSEFHSTLNSIKSRSSQASSSSSSSLSSSKDRDREPNARLLPKDEGRPAKGGMSEFGRMAGGIAKDINSTTLKLQKLAQRTPDPRLYAPNLLKEIVAKRKTLFDDRPIEISELTYIIRQDIASLNTQIASLQSYVRAQKPSGGGGGKGQVEEHNSNVVMLLQSRLANMGMGFKDVLELRTQVSRVGVERANRAFRPWVRGRPEVGRDGHGGERGVACRGSFRGLAYGRTLRLGEQASRLRGLIVRKG